MVVKKFLNFLSIAILNWTLLSLFPSQSAAQTTKRAPQKSPKSSQLDPFPLKERNRLHQKFLQTMKRELERNLQFLKKQPIPKVYSLRYLMKIRRQFSISASDGVIKFSSDSRKKPSRVIKVDIRVGDYNFDQTGQDGLDWQIYRSLLREPGFCPTELTEKLLQKKLWRKTDFEYRGAVGRYWRKKYVRSIKPKVLDKWGDYTKEPPTIYLAPLEPGLPIDLKKWKGILKRVSALSKNIPRIISSNLTLSGTENIILGVGNDGSKVRLRQWSYDWTISIRYLGKNKEYVKGTDSGTVRYPSELPSEKELREKFVKLALSLRELVNSKKGEPDEGPAIVDPVLAGAMFYDILMVKLQTNRFIRKYGDKSFADKLGKVIIPTFLTVIDDPRMKYWGKTPLMSHYLFDDEWVPARRLVMIEKGVLKNFYLSRKPYKNFRRSNGHGRGSFYAQPVSRPGTVIVQSSREFPIKKLRKMLIKLAKEQGRKYAYILKSFRGYSQVRNAIYTVKPKFVYRIDVETGKMERLKGMQVRSAALQLIRDIVATGDDYGVFNGSDSEDSGFIRISTVAPSLLIKRVAFNTYNHLEKKDLTLKPPFKPETLAKFERLIRKARPAVQKCPKKCPEICKCPACRK